MDVNKIKEDFRKIIKYSQKIENPKLDELFDNWLKAKNDFIEIFNGECIYEYPEKIIIELDEREKQIKIDKFFDILRNRWNYNELVDFIIKQSDGFFDNIVVNDYINSKGILIKKGSKLVKSFKYFVKDKKSLQDIQNLASRVIQEVKIEGILCLSVHPLDFLSLSENIHNWRTCHSLDGDFRAGNLSYMLDKTTFICYLKSNENAKLPNFPPEVEWNSKKWRVLLFLSEDKNLILSGRQYPYESELGIKFLLNELLPSFKIFNENNWTNWEKITEDNTINIKDFSILIDEIVKQSNGTKCFNDLLHSHYYVPSYAYKYIEDENGIIPLIDISSSKIIVGGYTYCLHCGVKEILLGSSTMMCESCELEYGTEENELFSFCIACGKRIYRDDGFFYEGEVFCYDCYHSEFETCQHCGLDVFTENILYSELIQEYVCRKCYNNLNKL